jgi:putative ABC transport system permease protein
LDVGGKIPPRQVLGVGLVRDIVVAGRGLRRRPSFALLSVLTLTSGVGIATTIFGITDAVLLKPLPFFEPDQLVAIGASDRGSGTTFGEISYPAMALWRDRSRGLRAVGGMASANSGMLLTGDGEPQRVPARLVSGNFFSVLGVAPALGRAFVEEEGRAEGPPAVVLGHALWRERFESDPGVVGRSVILNGRPFTVVGVMGEGFAYPEGAQAWVSVGPALPQLLSDPSVWWMLAIGRLKHGESGAAAAGELTALFRSLYRESFDVDGAAAVVRPLSATIFGASRDAFLALLCAAGLVLLITCANVAGLFLVRTIERSGELAVRQALGASRGGIQRLLLVESLLLALLGCAGGLVAARMAIPLVVALSPQELPRLHQAGVDPRTVAFAFAASVFAGALSGMAPALFVGRLGVEETLRKGGGRIVSGRRGLRGALVAGEVAIAFVLLVGAGLLGRSFVNLSRVPLGFEPRGVVSLPVRPPETRYPGMGELRAFDEALLSRVRGLPGVDSAAVVLQRPLSGTVGDDFPFVVEGQSLDEQKRNPLSNLEAVSVDYFRTMGIAVKRGRVFEPGDTEGKAGVAVVGESFARRYWPDRDPIGQHIQLPMRGGPYNQAWLTVVGVVADVRYRELEKTRLDIYISYLQAPERVGDLVVRGGGSASALASGVRAAVRSMDPDLPVGDLVFLPDVVSAALGSPLFATRLFATFATVAILLAALGLHGLLAYSVGQRVREISLRIALGAQRGDVLYLVIQESAGPVLVGIVVGLGAAGVAARLLSALLYGVSPRDPGVFVAAGTVLALVGLATSVVPARRAARVDPLTALRSE